MSRGRSDDAVRRRCNSGGVVSRRECFHRGKGRASGGLPRGAGLTARLALSHAAMVFAVAAAAGGQVRIGGRRGKGGANQRKAEDGQQQHCPETSHLKGVYYGLEAGAGGGV